MTLREAYNEAKRRLQASGADSPEFDAACLFEKYTGIGRGQLPLRGHENALLPEEFWRDVGRRQSGEPLQYILGEWEFMGLDFYVGPGVLIPRPETELLAQTAIDALRGKSSPRLLELCAGSGCVTIAVCRTLPDVKSECVEISPDAAKYLDKNIARHGLSERVTARHGDMLDESCIGACCGPFDAIVCNPPYIKSGDLPSLQREVRDHEPALALDGGEDGLKFYRALGSYFALLKPGGTAACEIGTGQEKQVSEIFRNAGLCGVRCGKDLAGIGRVVSGTRGAAHDCI